MLLEITPSSYAYTLSAKGSRNISLESVNVHKCYPKKTNGHGKKSEKLDASILNIRRVNV